MNSEPFLIALIGFLIVFAVLVLISSAIRLLGWILRCLGIPGCSPAQRASAVPAVTPEVNEATASEDSEAELTAVMSAVLMEENGWTEEEFRIVSIDALGPTA